MHGQIALDPRVKYRPDIDGLRAIAVLSVLVFHYGAPLPPGFRLPGGFTGVDVFFVISGFLITSKLAEDIAAGTFSILGFYDRRIRRILPALLVMLSVTLLAGKFLLMPGDYSALAISTATAAFGVSNFFFLNHTGYFDQAADLMPLLHTWSLAVEEQFYVVWPIALFAISAGRKKIDIAAVTTAIVIVGFAASLLWFDYDRKEAFYSALPRTWELAIGASLVFLPPLSRTIGEIAAIAGLVLIGTGFLVISDHFFPGPSALYPCLGAAMVVWPRKSETIAASWLGYLSPIGLISYSLYLWHWPVWVFFRIYINNSQPRIREELALAATSIAIAIISYLYVERPFRRYRWQAKSSVGAGLTASTIVFCLAMLVYRDDGSPGRIPRNVSAMQSLEVMWTWPCQMQQVSTTLPQLCVFGSDWQPGKRKAILWGDSNAEHLAPFLKTVAEKEHVAVALAPNCAPILDGQTILYIEPSSYNESCGRTNAAIGALLRTSPDVQTVILSGSWNYFLAGIYGGHGRETFERAMAELVGRLLAMNRDVVIITTAPQWSRDPIPCALIDAGLPRRPCDEYDRQLSKTETDRNNKVSLEIFARLGDRFPKLRIINLAARLCPSEPCLTRLNGEFLYRDSGHFRRNLSVETNADFAIKLGLDTISRSLPDQPSFKATTNKTELLAR